MKIRVVHWQLSGFYFFYYATLAAWIPYWGAHLSNRGFGVEFVGLSMAVILAMRIVGAAIWGYLGNRYKNYLFLIRMGALLSCLSYTFLLFADTRTAILLSLLAVSCCWSGILPQFEMITLSRLHRTPENYSWIRLWGSFGFVCAVIVLGFVYGWLSVRILPYCVFMMMLCATFLTFSVPKGAPITTSDTKASLRPLLTDPMVLSFLVSCALIHLSHAPYYSFYTIYLRDFGYSHETIGALWALGVIAEMLMFVWLPRVMLRYWVALLLMSVFLTSLRWGILAISDGRLWLLILVQFLHAASFGSFHAVGVEWIRRTFIGDLAGRGQALYNAVGFGVGGTLGALSSGMLWPIFGGSIVYIGAALAAFSALLFCIPVIYAARRDGDSLGTRLVTR